MSTYGYGTPGGSAPGGDAPGYSQAPGYPGPGGYRAPPRDPTAVIGKRIAAWVVDGVLVSLLLVLFSAAGPFGHFDRIPEGIDDARACEIIDEVKGASACFRLDDRVYYVENEISYLGALALLAWFVLVYVVWQGLSGATPGKTLLKVRVVDEAGGPPGLGKSALRSVLWIADGAPYVVPLVGFVTGLTSTGHRRVGDMVTHTYVVDLAALGRPVVVPGEPPPAPAVHYESPQPGMPAVPPAPPVPSGPPVAPPAAPPPVPEPPAPQPSPRDPQPSPYFPTPERPAFSPPEAEQTLLPPFKPSIPRELLGEQEPATEETLDRPPTEPSEGSERSLRPDISAFGDEPAASDDRLAEPEASIPPAIPVEPTRPPLEAEPQAEPQPQPGPETQPESESTEPVYQPQWDPARGAYIQWDPNRSSWLQWDDAAKQWHEI